MSCLWNAPHYLTPLLLLSHPEPASTPSCCSDGSDWERISLSIEVIGNELWWLNESTFQEQLYLNKSDARLFLSESTILEVLRLCSFSGIFRFVQEDLTLHLESQDCCLRKGDFVVIFPPILHHDPEIFEAPDVSKHPASIAPSQMLQAHSFPHGLSFFCYLVPERIWESLMTPVFPSNGNIILFTERFS